MIGAARRGKLAESARAALGEASEHADALGRSLGVAHSLAATFRTMDIAGIDILAQPPGKKLSNIYSRPTWPSC